MGAVGIIAEYNPFHNGHMLHIARARELAGADAVIVAMSGMFTQRGEPALVDKWTRARMALRNGADLVFELPCLFALREAQGFAYGGVKLLDGLGIVDSLSFGCEPGCAALLQPVMECLREEPAPYKAALRRWLDSGMSWPGARAAAVQEYTGIAVPNAPNFALALEYAAANAALTRPMRLLPVERLSAHNSLELSGICSSSAIREALAHGNCDAAFAAMPESSAELLATALAAEDANSPNSPAACASAEPLATLALYLLRTATPERVADLPGVSEGLENLLISAARASASMDELLARCKSKRYTMARLKRLLPQLALGIDRKLQASCPAPGYARLLGARRGALPLLRQIKERGTLPLITDAMRLSPADELWQLEQRATDLWGLCSNSATARRAGWDLRHGFVLE